MITRRFGSLEWDIQVKYFTTSIFGGDTGLEVYDYNGARLLISGPERAFMECMHLSPEQFSLIDLHDARANQFEGMTDIPFTYEEFEQTRARLIQDVCALTRQKPPSRMAYMSFVAV